MTPAPHVVEPPAEASLVDRLERQNLELTILTTVATALNEAVDLPTALSAVLSRVADCQGLGTGWVLLLDEESGRPYLAAAQNLPPGLAESPELMEGSCYCLDTFRTGDLRGAANIKLVTCSRLKALTRGSGGLRFHASIPLYVRDRKLGVLNVASSEWRQLSPDDLRILHAIGDMLGVAIERARLLESSMRAGAAQERNRIAREIHDTLAQGLSATALQLETAEALLDGGEDPERVRATVHRALETTRRNLEEARRSVLDLRAAPLRGRTLVEAVAELCASAATERPPGPAVAFESAGEARRIPARVETALYRIAQEALSNALRHSRADTVTVRLDAQPAWVILSILDTGVGFELCQRRDGRFGLIGMRERVRLLGGDLRVYSRPGEGTRVEAMVPLD
jgi:two-component system, NarL family, sensor kinase